MELGSHRLGGLNHRANGRTILSTEPRYMDRIISEAIEIELHPNNIVTCTPWSRRCLVACKPRPEGTRFLVMARQAMPKALSPLQSVQGSYTSEFSAELVS
jgi:hypothetical protein